MKTFVCFLMLGGLLFGSDVSLSQSDFVERLINFVIFFAIAWYLGADKIKAIFLQRSQTIAHQFELLQAQEKKIKKEREQAEIFLEETRLKANEILSNAKKETFLIAQNFDSRLKKDVRLLSDSFEALLEQEKREILQEEINNTLDELFAKLDISEEEYLKILMKGLQNG